MYMYFQMLVAAIQSSYSMACQPVDYSDDPRALRVQVYFHLKKNLHPESGWNQGLINYFLTCPGLSITLPL